MWSGSRYYLALYEVYTDVRLVAAPPVSISAYGGDIDKAQIRAEGDMSDAWAAMCKVDTRQISTVTLSTVDGFQLERRTRGAFSPDPEPEPESEPTPESEET